MILKVCGLILILAMMTVSGIAKEPNFRPTRVVFYADTEDYTCDEANDGIRDFAKVMTSEGVRANFNIVGYLALRIQELGRKDVIEALKPHVLGTQSLYHSLHPTPAEYGDDPNYEKTYRRALKEEAMALGMVEAVFGEGRVVFSCPPGHSMALGNLEAKYDLGVLISAGGFVNCEGENLDIARPGTTVDGLWYFNVWQSPYCTRFFHLEYLIPGHENYVQPSDYGRVLDQLARYDLAGIGFHPNMAIKPIFWDKLNYRFGNMSKWREWKQVQSRPPEVTAAFYANVKNFVRAMKDDGRFVITDFEKLKAGMPQRVPITRNDLPVILTNLESDFNCISNPASWSVADCFQAVVRFLRGEDIYRPGKVYGFLSRPKGIERETRVSAVDLRAAAAAMDLATFIPDSIDVGGQKIGPADFLFAGLEVLTDGATEVVLHPREQLGSFKEVPSLEKFCLKGVWIFQRDFLDVYTTERLRLQLWTLRIDPCK